MEIIQSNGLKIPEYLTVKFFRCVLNKWLKIENPRIGKVVLSSVCSDGENFTSFIYRAVIEHPAEVENGILQSHFVIKCIPFDGHRVAFKQINVYGKEVYIYKEILPSIVKILKTKSISEAMAPRLIYNLENSSYATIVFEDIKAMGSYSLADRVLGFDQVHAEIVLRKLGIFHAASMVAVKQNPDITSAFDKSLLQMLTDNPIRHTMYCKNIKEMAKLAEKWQGFENIATKLHTLYSTFSDRIERCMNSESAFNVINHGDLWVNNCMFKYENGQPQNLLFIDFQMCYYGTPALDVHYFLNTSVQLQVLITKRYELLRTYYNALQSTLRTLEYDDIPTWEHFKNELNAKEIIGFWAFEAILPLLSMGNEHSKDNSFEGFSTDERARKIRQHMFTSERYLQTIKYCLDRFDEIGVLD